MSTTFEPLQRDDLIFEKIYSKYYQKIFAQALSIMKDTQLAEDMTHNTFLQVLKKIHTFKGNSKLSTWMNTICRNECLMKQRNRITKNELLLPTASEQGRGLESVRESISGNEIENTLAYREILSMMPFGYRRIIILHDVEGYEHHEIATKLNISIGTSKSQLCKARIRFYQLRDNTYKRKKCGRKGKENGSSK